MKAVVGAVCAVALFVVVIVGAVAGVVGAAGSHTTTASAPAAFAAVPEAMWALYQEGEARFGAPVGLLAAVGKVECDHGRNPDCGSPNGAGAIGPMQFLPGTFAAWSWASGSPAPSPLDARDAVLAAAAKLAADGARGDPAAALFSYNHSHAYVATVEAWALVYGWRPPKAGVLADAALNHPNLSLRTQAASDLRAGIVDDAVTAVVLVAATTHRLSWVGPFVSGHSFYVAGTQRPSNHAFGRAVDVPMVDGAPVTAANDGARRVVAMWASLPPDLRPDEIGSPWGEPLPGVRSFAEGHDDHLHAGFRG